MSKNIRLGAAIGFLIQLILSPSLLLAQSESFISDGAFAANFNLRYESSKQANNLEDANALTLRSRLTFSSGVVSGFSALVELEDVRTIAGIDDYTVGPTGFKVGRYSVIADPETTELDQGFLQYADDRFTAKVGRQVIVFDNQRFIGHVGWRQDRQTFDAASFAFQATENLSLNYNYIDQRRRIFAEDADLDSSDHLFHGDYKVSLGEESQLTIGAYAYLLELDDIASNSLDTYGLRLVGSSRLGDLPVNYIIEYATQDSNTAIADNNAQYFLMEAGITLDSIRLRVGREQLGSDEGAYGFSTPLATLHAHNGWADLFLATPASGLIDLYLGLSGSAGEGSWLLTYHEYDADDAPSSADDFGSELDLQYLRPLSDSTTLGIKYARYSGANGLSVKPDTDKFWVWLNFGF